MSADDGEILVVDDDAESLALLTRILTGGGHRVRPADSAKLALASVETSPPELILLDMRMPGMDGLEFCRWLKGRDESRQIPVVFVSGSTGPDERVEGLKLGAVDFLTKPFHTPELLARVRNHLELSRLRSQLENQVTLRTGELLSTVEQLQHEILERQRAEQALRESEQRFRAMADTAPVMILTSDANQLATFVNTAWLDFTGRTLDQELGRGWTDNVHPDDLETVLSGMDRYCAAREKCRLEYRLRRADGEYRFLMCRGLPRFEPDGAFGGYTRTLVDITELKRNQDALEEQRQRLRELSGRLLTAQENASRELARELHDVFSQELAFVGTKIFSLQEDAKCSRELKKPLLELGHRVVRLAHNIHRTSRDLHPTILDDLGLTHALIDVCEAFQSCSGIRTRFIPKNVPPEIPREISLCLYRVARESLRNIGKHAARASAVRVSLTGMPRGVTLRIEDNGHGFSLQETHEKGGLGLVSMEERVRLVNGSFSVHSKPGKGTTVEVVVPSPGLSAAATR